MQHDERFWPQEVSVGEVIYPPGGTLGPRYQKTLQLVLLHSGCMRLWVDGALREAPSRSVCILLPEHEEYFAFDTAGETHHSWVHIALPTFAPELLARLQRLSWPLPLSPSMTQLMRKALQLQTMPLSTAQEMLKSLALLMLWRYIGEGEHALVPAANGSTNGPPPAPLIQAQQFILTHLQEPLTLQQIAEVAAVSPFHLIRLFQKYLALTPIAYLWQQRVIEGVKMLEQTGLPIGTIAYQCGFQSRYHFSRRIRQETGFTPQEVRRRFWQQNAQEAK
jgi:AraC family transcriptional regulator of arabinose operon